MPAEKFYLRFFLLAVLAVFAGRQSLPAQIALAQRLDFEARNQPLGETLLNLSRVSGVAIGFGGHLVDTPRPVSISSKNEKLSAILDRLLENSDLAWRESNGQILVYNKPPPERVLSGFVEDASSGERLVGAFIMELNSGRSTTSNGYGFFSIRVPGNQAARVVVSMLGFQLAKKELAKGAARNLVLQLRPAQTAMAEVEVSSDSVAEQLRPFYLKKEENLARIPFGLLPAPGGEADLIRAVTLLPGIESSIDGLGGWSIRGGDMDQNLVLVDDAVVFHPEHALGLFSAFNPDIVRSARLWKGDAPARLGGRVASALEVRTREGNLERFAGSASLSWMAARLSIEMPLQKEKGAMLFSARRSLAGPVLKYFSRKALEKDGWDGATDYHFSDLNWKIFWTFNTRNRVYLSLYQGSDFYNDNRKLTETETIIGNNPNDPGVLSFTFDLNSRYQWKNRFASLRWNRIFSDNCFANTTLTASHFVLQASSRNLFGFQDPGTSETFRDTFSSTSQTKLFDYTLKTDADWYATGKLTLRGGGQASVLHVMPFYYFGDAGALPVWVQLDEDNLPEASTNVKFEKGITLAVHGEAEWMPGSNWRLRAGLRAETFSNRGKSWFLPQPRISIEKKWKSGVSWSASWSVLAQALRTVSPNYIESAGDVWLLASSALPPQQTSQITTGLGWTSAGWAARLEFYYKKMNRVETYQASWLSYFDSVYFTDPNQIVFYNEGLRSWEQEVELGLGRAAGLEVLLEKTTGNTTGWISWTLSKSERKFENLNNNQWFAARFDRRHHFKLALFQRLGAHCSVSATWQIASGDAISKLLISSEKRVRLLDIHSQGLWVERLGYGDYRQPWQHRLDVNATWKWQSGSVNHQLSAGFYNAYNQTNTYFTYWIDSSDYYASPLVPQKINGLPWLPHLTWGIQF
ncbi:MAG: carboxypeptidase-like regulatory domain-containing protein [Lewinellaceae bacterium]|nr:carboxypeptidase-like regulatory domain-containing protein [Lewinellaceae bacterium]